jgi:hypothetical protein
VIIRDVKAIFKKEFENCENCPVQDQPDPERECERCMAAAEAAGRSVGLHPATAQIFNIRALQRVGYRFDPDDLAPWQWHALVAVDDAIEAHKAEVIKRHGREA